MKKTEMFHRSVWIFFYLLVLMPGLALPALAQVSSITDLRSPHRTTLESWLKNRPMLMLATEKDCLNKVGLAASREEYGRDYQPYYAIADFNHDGQQDFAVALINKQKRSRRFAIAIFNGPFNQKRTSAPAFFAEGIDLSDGGLVILSGNRLVAGVFQSDDCVVLRPRGRTYVTKSCL